MEKPTERCALLAGLLSRHGWGTPIPEDALLSISAVDRSPAAREAFTDLRSRPYVENHGARGIALDSSAFGNLADVLYRECGWEPWEIRSRLKHYEGWENHEWG